MITQTRPETSSYAYAALRRFRGERAKVHAKRGGGSHVSRSGKIVSIGLRNVTVEVESGSKYRIPLSAITNVEVL